MAQIVRQYKHRHTSNTKQNKKKKQCSSSPFQWSKSFLHNSVKCMERKKKTKTETQHSYIYL